MHQLQTDAPSGGVTPYDRLHLALYAALLDADATGKNWREVVTTVMQLDPDKESSVRCWRSHLDRARWIVGEGLASAIETFGHSAEAAPH